MCILGFDAPRCSSPIFNQKHKFSYCSSRCLDPALAIVTAVELDSISCKFVSIPENMVSLVLVGRYGAHASTSHAQDCPDRKLERPILPWSSGISLCLLQEISFLWPWSGVMVLMLWHHTHKTVLTGG